MNFTENVSNPGGTEVPFSIRFSVHIIVSEKGFVYNKNNKVIKGGGSMKIIHCADIHLDSKMSANLTKEKAKERKTELLTTFQNMVEYGASHEVDAILIAGDLFDTKNVSATARNIVKDLIQGHPSMEFYYLQGNHDEGSFTGGLSEIPENLHLFGSSWTSYGVSKKVCITGVELNPENSGSICHTLSLDADRINIVTLHGQESEYSARDKAEIIHLTALKNKGIDYLALGHIHSYKKERLDGRGVYCYPGCLEGRGFDECGEHGFVMLSIDEAAGTMESRFVPFAARNLYTIPVDITGCNSTMDILDRMKKETAEKNYPAKSLVKYELTGKIDVESEKDTDFLLHQFADRFYFVKLRDSSEYLVDYVSFAKDMSLKGEFIRTVMGREDLSEEDKAAVIHYGLQALAGEEILDA